MPQTTQISDDNNNKMNVELCKPDWLVGQLHDKQTLILLDCRSQDHYHSLHINNAIWLNIPCGNMLIRRFRDKKKDFTELMQEKDKKRFKDGCHSVRIVVYNNDSSSITNNDKDGIGLVVSLLKDMNGNIVLLEGEYIKYFCGTDNSWKMKMIVSSEININFF